MDTPLVTGVYRVMECMQLLWAWFVKYYPIIALFPDLMRNMHNLGMKPHLFHAECPGSVISL